MSASPAPAPPAPTIGDGSAGGAPSPAPGAELDEAAAELLPSIDGGSDGTLVSAASPAPAPPVPAIESGNTGGLLSSMPSTELDEAVAELRDDVPKEAAALLADERVRGVKKFIFLAARWLSASAWGVHFFAAFAAIVAALSLLPVGLPAGMLNSAK